MTASRKVIVDRIRFTPVTRKTHLVKVPRWALFLSARDYYQLIEDDEKKVKLLTEGRAHQGDRFLISSGIVCDGCSDPILTPYVWVLILSYPWIAWGTQCENCRQRYHKDKPAYVLVHKYAGVL